MRTWILVWLLVAGCGTASPTATNIRDGRGYCPICTEWHGASEMRWPIEHGGKTYRFCDPNCRAAFVKEPEKYLKDPQFNPRE